MSRGVGPYPFPTLPGPVRQFVSISVVIMVFFLARSPASLIDDGTLFLLLSVTVLGSAWFAGTGAAIAVTSVGAIVGAFATDDRASVAVQTHVVLFLIQGFLLTLIVSELRRTRRLAEREARVAHAARLEGETASRMKDEFLTTISHELRTPLNAILGWAVMLRNNSVDVAKIPRAYEAIFNNATRQGRLIEELLDVSRIVAGRASIDLQEIDIAENLRGAVEAMMPSASAKGVEIRFDAPTGVPCVIADPRRVEQVFLNLLSNAVKFTPAGGRVQIQMTANTGS
ncbi:MAG TPA: HAMP domain-containing sensor histidine kinase, partial [Vicinamibacterales bacterium]